MASLILFQNVLNARLETVLEMQICCATPVEKGTGAEIVEAATVASVTAKLPEPVVRAVLMMGVGWLVGIG